VKEEHGHDKAQTKENKRHSKKKVVEPELKLELLYAFWKEPESIVIF
jgi:hypothetical protein